MRMIRKVIILIIALSMVMAMPVTSHAKARLNKTKVTLTVGETVKLKVKGTKAKVKWSSTKKSVASVSKKGKVKARKKGKAYIVAKVGGKKYKCRIIVKAPKSSAYQNALERPNAIKDLSPYLKSSTNCQVGNPSIKKIVASLTSGLSSDNTKIKAEAIYNYVNDNISTDVFGPDNQRGIGYEGHYYSHNIIWKVDTRYGAAGTLSAKGGASADQAHLLIAMLRTAGIPARYVHGTVSFQGRTAEIFGNKSEHVWVEYLTERNKWHILDTVKDVNSNARSHVECELNIRKNSFGTIETWDLNNYVIRGTYASLPI